MPCIGHGNFRFAVQSSEQDGAVGKFKELYALFKL